MSDLAARFADAQARIKPVTGLGNDVMLALYALFKQASEGDAKGKRPGFTDFVGRAKYDAWAGLAGTSSDQAKADYIAKVAELQAAE